MKIGSVVWNYTSPHYAAPYEEAIDNVARLGFDGIEMMVFSADDLSAYYTPKRTKELSARIADRGLAISQVSIYHTLVDGFASTDATARQLAFDNFARCVEVAKGLGGTMVNFVSPWPQGLEGPTPYPPHAIYPEIRGQQRFSPKVRLRFPPDFDWAKLWEAYVSAIQAATALAKDAGLKLVLEGHCHVMVPGADAFLRLFDRIPDPALGVNFDTSWHLKQREDVAVSLAKLGSRVLHLHARDGDGALCYNLPPGLGIIDWDYVIATLHRLGFKGFLTLEMARYEETDRYLKGALEYLRSSVRHVTAAKEAAAS